MKEDFTEGVNKKCDGNEDWSGLERKLLDVASEICGYRKVTPGILKRGGGIKMWLWLCVERGSYLGFGNRVRMRKMGRNIVRQKKKLVYIAIDQKAWEAVEKVDSCCDGHESFRIAKQRAGEKRCDVYISCLKDESGVVKVSVDD